ncbi:MAG: hypothetical protein AB8G15_11535 [Saprospiraceae bacterium]
MTIDLYVRLVADVDQVSILNLFSACFDHALKIRNIFNVEQKLTNVDIL